MIDVRQTPVFAGWFADLDDATRTRIATRIVRLRNGLLGDVKSIDAGLSELRIDHGPGYRVYFTRRGRVLVLLLCGGDKRTQRRDIARARAMAAEWKAEQ